MDYKFGVIWAIKVPHCILAIKCFKKVLGFKFTFKLFLDVERLLRFPLCTLVVALTIITVAVMR